MARNTIITGMVSGETAATLKKLAAYSEPKMSLSSVINQLAMVMACLEPGEFLWLMLTCPEKIAAMLVDAHARNMEDAENGFSVAS